MEKYYKQGEFKKWLENDTLRWNDPNSVKSYISGVGALIDLINRITYPKKIFNYLEKINNQADRDTFFSAALNIIQKEIDAPNKKDKSTLQNYKSYLRAFEEFFESEPFSGQGLSKTERTLLRSKSSCATYTHDELIKEFMGRILTQDRISMSKDVMFPIRLIRKLWKDKAESWAKSVCENIWIIVKDKETPEVSEKQVKDIATLSIRENGEVTIITKDSKEYIMCTSYSDPHESLRVVNNKIEYVRKRKTVFVANLRKPSYIVDKNKNIIEKGRQKKIIFWHVREVKVKNLGDIAIDHDFPISQVLIDNAKKLRSLKNLSDEYRRLSGEYGIKVSAKNANDFCTRFQIEDLKENNFPEDDMKLIGKYKLVLMGKDENSQKSDS